MTTQEGNYSIGSNRATITYVVYVLFSFVWNARFNFKIIPLDGGGEISLGVS